MYSLTHLLEINIRNNTGTEFFYHGDGKVEEEELKVIEVKNSAVIIRYIKRKNQPYALFGLWELYWRKENHVFQEKDPDLYCDDISLLHEIKNSEFYKELAKKPIGKEWDFGYWGIRDE